MEELLQNSEPDKTLHYIDSLEEESKITDVQANYWRGEIYHKTGNKVEAEGYWKQTLEGDIYKQENLKYYYKTASSYADMISMWTHNYQKSLEIAMPAVATIEEREHTDIDVYPILLYTIGISQLRLEKFEEGGKTLHRALDIYDDVMKDDSTSYSSLNKYLMMTNIVIIYLNRDKFGEAEHWLHRAEKALDDYASHPQAEASRTDRAKGRICLLLAEILEKTGKHKEAAKVYDEALQTGFLQTTDGKLDATAYLQAAGRWNEAADIYIPLDSILASWHIKPSLRTLSGLMMSKFRSNMGAGRKDSAFAASVKICNALDSAIAKERNDKAAELATIYETHEKEKTIAQQHVQLTTQRAIGFLTAFFLIVVFLSIIFVHRYRAAMSLKTAHEKLQEAYGQLKDKNEALKVANARAEESSKMKTNFIQQISHEIRTPLNILSGFTQVITTPSIELDEETKADINRQITDNTNRITGLVNKMLELSEINSASSIERTDDVSATQIAHVAIEDSGIGKAPHLTFHLQVGEGIDATLLHTNIHCASRALALLLDNACKFTHPAEAHARHVVLEKKEKVNLVIRQQQSAVQFIIEDTGIGVPPEEAEHIFEDFVQLDEYYDGTGIGLTVARNLARRLGGDITLDTTYQPGARFVLTLPLT
ncbi:MAG: HAMP domain-containing histidine kinase [Prevotella sp.]|nr:HAMP domain-containing histidine kinase [Prevotella sp.]